VSVAEVLSPQARRAFVARWFRSLGAASVTGLGTALVDAIWARAKDAEPPPLVAVWLADAGITAPIALLLAAAVGSAALFFHPQGPPSLARMSAALTPASEERRAYLAVAVPCAALATLVFTVAAARGALVLLATETSPAVAGAVLGGASAALATLLGLVVLGAGRSGAALLQQRRVDPRLTAAIGIAVSLVLFAGFVAAGTTSGAGGALDVFGVFKRPELDLRAPALLLAIAVAAYFAPALARLPGLLALAIALLPLLLLPWSAARGLEERRVSLAVERGAPLGKIALAVSRRATDRDHDGFSARFGGGDCDDHNAAKNPNAVDVPGNRVDEDCSGSDDVAVKLEKAAPEAPADARQSALSKLPEKPNVVLITIDTLRWDLGYTGNPRPLSPNLDRLAKQSVVLDRAYSLASYTGKSLAPLLIGKYSSETHRGWSHFNRFGKEDVFLQERLQRAGIRTVSVQGYWYFYQAGYGFERGFDVVDSEAAPKVIQMEGDRTANSDKISDRAIAQLSDPANTGRQFYAWVHYIDPHTEYAVHEEFDFGSGSRERYDGEVAFVDKHVGRVIDFIEKSAFGARTAIIVTSDHGEAFGEHGMIRHGFELWEELVRVPWIFKVPGASPHHVTAPRSGIDLVPTLLELFRLQKPEANGDDFVSGESLLLDLFMPPGYEPKPRIIFIDMAAGPNNAERQALIENEMKLTATGGRPLGLYDLKSDPLEKKDLLDDKPRAEPVIARYKAFRRTLKEVVVRPAP
jgi:arylsulfatase A-like enzyme